MALMTHAHTRPEADYNALSEDVQDRFDQYMERADHAATNGEYLALMVLAGITAGLDLPYGDHIRKCACRCWCPVIFNPDHADAHCIESGDGYNLGRHQCPTCADRHRETA
ncbi:hypothetical protein ACIP2X_38230 [Streptomyces sp. NPDC089424]|uniref:hypothetical protein n=1 Tax=Streptomyces sp. NPDC089424 TaxID=3365917 RepID=UPI0038085CEB